MKVGIFYYYYLAAHAHLESGKELKDNELVVVRAARDGPAGIRKGIESTEGVRRVMGMKIYLESGKELKVLTTMSSKYT
mgnify:CR=1 FL=1